MSEIAVTFGGKQVLRAMTREAPQHHSSLQRRGLVVVAQSVEEKPTGVDQTVMVASSDIDMVAKMTPKAGLWVQTLIRAAVVDCVKVCKGPCCSQQVLCQGLHMRFCS